MSPPALTPQQIQRMQKRLLKKGAEINAKLVDILSQKERVPAPMLPGGKPGATEEERLRRFMALIDAALRAIREGRYGRCVDCGEGLPFAHLEQVPWIDTCQACAARKEE